MQNSSQHVKETPNIFQHHCASLKESTPEASSKKEQRFGSTIKPFCTYVTYATTPGFSSTRCRFQRCTKNCEGHIRLIQGNTQAVNPTQLLGGLPTCIMLCINVIVPSIAAFSFGVSASKNVLSQSTLSMSFGKFHLVTKTQIH
jgi:hypothetical protein